METTFEDISEVQNGVFVSGLQAARESITSIMSSLTYENKYVCVCVSVCEVVFLLQHTM